MAMNASETAGYAPKTKKVPMRRKGGAMVHVSADFAAALRKAKLVETIAGMPQMDRVRDTLAKQPEGANKRVMVVRRNRYTDVLNLAHETDSVAYALLANDGVA